MQSICVELQANHHNSGLVGQAASILELKLMWANWCNAHIFVVVNCVCVGVCVGAPKHIVKPKLYLIVQI